MALQKRVSELPAVTTVAGTDLLIVSSNSATKRTSVQQIGAYFAANGVAGPQGPVGPAGAPGATNYTQLTNVPSTFPPSAHGHTIADVSGLQTALDGKQASGSYATLVGGKVPESQLPPIVTTWEGLTGKPSTFPPSTHSHVIADVTGLQTAIDGKAASSHTHTISNVTGLQTALDAKATPADVTSAVASVVNAAPASLDTLKELADALGNDANFASTVTNAIAGKAAAVHTHVIGDVTGLQTALDGKQASGSYAAASHGHVISDVTGLQTALDGKSGVSHTHTALQITDFAAAVAAASPEEVVEYLTTANFPATGNASLLYIATDAGRAYRWVGSQYAEIGPAVAFLPVHSHAASDITSGVLATARLGSGTADATTYLRGDSTFAPAVTNVNGKTGAVLPGTVFEFTRTSGPAGATLAGSAWTWTPPSNCTLLEFLFIGAGGGGGSGRRGAAGSARFGGGAGSGGNVTYTTIPRSLITTALTIFLPAGGAGGAAQTADDSNGNAGTSAQTGTINASGVNMVIALGGVGGSAGTTTTGTGATSGGNNNRTYAGGAGGSSSITANASSGGGAGGISPFGGGGGGGISAANVAYNGGNAFSYGGAFYYVAGVTGSTGGAASTTAEGGTGADGRTFGYGGSGGGASTNGFNSGAGGNGGDAFLRITIW
jgi:hypothetical protein